MNFVKKTIKDKEHKFKISDWIQFGLLIATLSMVIVLIFQTCSLQRQTETQKNQTFSLQEQTKTQIKNFNLTQRPYVYLDIRNVRIEPRIDVDPKGKLSTHNMVTAVIEFKNEGTIPAVIKDIKYFVSTDKDLGSRGDLDLPGYFKKNFGSFPHPTVVFPKQESLVFTYRADCAAYPERVYFNAVVSYEGSQKDKGYWYSFNSKSATIPQKNILETRLPNGKKIQAKGYIFETIRLQMEGDWDKDEGLPVPHVHKPNLENEKEFIKKQRELLKY
ncbi:MAG: hypothetical protein ACFFG0_17635 [Candidatus Thorarchaeota archaeon]